VDVTLAVRTRAASASTGSGTAAGTKTDRSAAAAVSSVGGSVTLQYDRHADLVGLGPGHVGGIEGGGVDDVRRALESGRGREDLQPERRAVGDPHLQRGTVILPRPVVLGQRLDIGEQSREAPAGGRRGGVWGVDGENPGCEPRRVPARPPSPATGNRLLTPNG